MEFHLQSQVCYWVKAVLLISLEFFTVGEDRAYIRFMTRIPAVANHPKGNKGLKDRWD